LQIDNGINIKLLINKNFSKENCDTINFLIGETLMISKTIIACLAVLTSVAINAQTKFSQNSYLDVGYSSINYSDSLYSRKPTALRLVYGQNTTENLGWEGLIGLGLTTDNAAGVVNPANTVGVKVPTTYGLYAKGYVKPSDSFEIFGRLGWASIGRDLTCTGPTCTSSGVTDSSTGASLSYGAGLRFKVTKDWSISTDYMSYYNRDGVAFNAMTIGASVGF